MVASPPERDVVTVTERDIRAIERFARALEPYLQGGKQDSAQLIGPDGEMLEIPEPIYAVLRQAIPLLVSGDAVALIPVHAELTTQQAADLLNVSRPFLIKLLEEGVIPFSRTGTHRRIHFADLMAYKSQRDSTRREKLSQLTQMSQRLGLYGNG